MTPYDPNFDPILEERRKRGRAEMEALARAQADPTSPKSEWDILAAPFQPDYAAALNRPQAPTPGVPAQMAPKPQAQAPQTIPAPPSAIGRDVELDRLYEDYKQKVEHPDLGFAWGGGTPQAWRPGEDIRSGQYGAPPTEGTQIRAGTTDFRMGGTAPQTRGGTFSQSDMEGIPIGQRPASWFEDQTMETELMRQYADRSKSQAAMQDPFGLSRYQLQFQNQHLRDRQLDTRKQEVLEDLDASIQMILSDSRWPEDRKEAEIARMRQEAFAQIEAIDPRADFKAYMGAF